MEEHIVSAQTNADAQPPSPPTYRGNRFDLYSLIAGTLGGATLLLCMSGGMAYYCLPVVPLILGIIALRNSKFAVDPQRTRTLAWLGIGGGGLATLAVIVLMGLIVLYMLFIFTLMTSMFTTLPRPTPTTH